MAICSNFCSVTSKRKMLYQTVFRDVVRQQRRNSMTVTEMKQALAEIYKPFLTVDMMDDICRLTRLEEKPTNHSAPRVEGWSSKQFTKRSKTALPSIVEGANGLAFI